MTFCGGGFAQKYDIKKHPGYVDLDKIRIPDTVEESTDLDLGPLLLGLMSLGGDEDEELSEGLAGILSIRVKSYEIGWEEDVDMDDIMRDVKRLDKKLKNDEWVPIIRSKSRDSMTNVSMKMDNGKMVGFFLMSVDPDDGVTFMNIVGGNIDIDKIKDFGLGLNNSTLDSLKKSFEHFRP